MSMAIAQTWCCTPGASARVEHAIGVRVRVLREDWALSFTYAPERLPGVHLVQHHAVVNAYLTHMSDKNLSKICLLYF